MDGFYKCYFSLVKDWFPMRCKIKEEQEGQLFRKENFKESSFHVLYVKGREQKADIAIYSLSLFFWFFFWFSLTTSLSGDHS